MLLLRRELPNILFSKVIAHLKNNLQDNDTNILKYSAYTLRYESIWDANEPESRELYLMSHLPQNTKEYQNNYIFCDNENDKKLYYIKDDGTVEDVPITDFEKFAANLNVIPKINDKQLHLSNKHIEELITANGGHNPHSENRRVDLLRGALLHCIFSTQFGEISRIKEDLYTYDFNETPLPPQLFTEDKGIILLACAGLALCKQGVDEGQEKTIYDYRMNLYQHIASNLKQYIGNDAMFNNQEYDKIFDAFSKYIADKDVDGYKEFVWHLLGHKIRHGTFLYSLLIEEDPKTWIMEYLHSAKQDEIEQNLEQYLISAGYITALELESFVESSVKDNNLNVLKILSNIGANINELSYREPYIYGKTALGYCIEQKKMGTFINILESEV